MHCYFELVRIKERIWIILLEGIFELIFFHEDIHYKNWLKKGALVLIGFWEIGERKKNNSNMELFWILFWIDECSICFKQWRMVWILLHSDNNCICETIGLMLELELYQFIFLFVAFQTKRFKWRFYDRTFQFKNCKI